MMRSHVIGAHSHALRMEVLLTHVAQCRAGDCVYRLTVKPKAGASMSSSGCCSLSVVGLKALRVLF